LANAPGFIRFCLQAVGLFNRAQNNSRKLRTAHNSFVLPDLPEAFEGFRILHLTDLHVDMDEQNLQAVIRQIEPLDYDLCVLTGDYRQRTWGPVEDRKSTRLNSSHVKISYAVFCLKKKTQRDSRLSRDRRARLGLRRSR